MRLFCAWQGAWTTTVHEHTHTTVISIECGRKRQHQRRLDYCHHLWGCLNLVERHGHHHQHGFSHTYASLALSLSLDILLPYVEFKFHSIPAFIIIIIIIIISAACAGMVIRHRKNYRFLRSVLLVNAFIDFLIAIRADYKLKSLTHTITLSIMQMVSIQVDWFIIIDFSL